MSTYWYKSLCVHRTIYGLSTLYTDVLVTIPGSVARVMYPLHQYRAGPLKCVLWSDSSGQWWWYGRAVGGEVSPTNPGASRLHGFILFWGVIFCSMGVNWWRLLLGLFLIDKNIGRLGLKTQCHFLRKSFKHSMISSYQLLDRIWIRMEYAYYMQVNVP